MATIQDINAGSNYIGESALGGGFTPFVELNTRPLDQLAAYTMLSNQVKWKQKQYETDLKVRELADLSKISLNDLRGKDKEQATKEFAVVIKKASEYARKQPKNEQERLENELEWQTTIGAFKNNYSSGKGRAVSYYSQRNAIEREVSDAATKEEQIRQLDETFDKTGIDIPISAVPNFKTETAEIPKHVSQTFNGVIIEPNRNIATHGTYYDPTVNGGIADAAILGLKTLYPKEGTPEYDKLSDEQKKQARVQATIKSPSKVWLDAVELLNPILAKYTKDGIFDETSFENDNASNTTVMQAYNGLKNFNAYNRQKFEQATAKKFDSQGLQIQLPNTVIPNNFKAGFVDFAKGVNANQLVQAGMFAQYKGDEFKPTIQETDNARQNEELRLRFKQLDLEETKINKANDQDKLAAFGVLREITDIINTGDVPENQVNVYDERTKTTKSVFKIGDPTILQKFGNVDKDGTTTNVPDEARYNPKTNEIDLVYFKKDVLGEIETTKTGRIIRDIKPLNARTWANMVVQRSGSGKERGEVNEIIQSVITKNGGDLYKIAKKINGVTTEQPTTQPPLSDAQKYLNSLKKK